MNGHRAPLLVALGVILAVVLVFNDFLASLAYSGELIVTSYVVHLGLLALVVTYAIYLKVESFALKDKLAVYRQAWRQIPGGVAVISKSKLVEICAAADLFRIFGLTSGEVDGDKMMPVLGGMTRREEKREVDGKTYYADRFTIPLTDFPGDYTVEFLLDVSDRVTRLRRRESEYVQMLKILVNMFEIKDPYSHGHSEVVSHLAQELARALQLPEAEIDTICKAALLHDIGKIIIPPEVLGKSEKLSAAEAEKIKTHASVGAAILGGMELFREEAVIVRHHHERFDGGGYPTGLSGTDIPIGSRIIAVVDTFDAMTAGRLARGQKDVAETLVTLEEEKGRQFDPEIVEAFIIMVREERAERK